MNHPITGRVAQILTKRELVINRGARDGVNTGMKFAVMDPRVVDITDPDTGENLGSVWRPKVSVEVIEVEEHLSVARTFEKVAVNVGGTGIGSIGGFSSLFLPAPQYVERFKTLETSQAEWQPLDERDSFVKRGDPVREIIEEDGIPPAAQDDDDR